MGTFSFIVKTVVATAILVLVLQVKWDRATLEEHTMAFLSESSLVQPVNKTADGLVRLIRNTWNGAMQSLDTNFTRAMQSDSRPGQRQLKFNPERSKEYLVKKKEEAAQSAKEGYEYAKKEVRDQTSRFKKHLQEEGVIEQAEE